MKIKRSHKHGYEILSIAQDITIHVDMSDLAPAVEKLVKKNMYNIALRFTAESHLSTRAIPPLLQCAMMLRDRGETLVLIEPNDDIKDALHQVGLDLFICIVESENDLAILHRLKTNCSAEKELN